MHAVKIKYIYHQCWKHLTQLLHSALSDVMTGSCMGLTLLVWFSLPPAVLSSAADDAITGCCIGMTLLVWFSLPPAVLSSAAGDAITGCCTQLTLLVWFSLPTGSPFLSPPLLCSMSYQQWVSVERPSNFSALFITTVLIVISFLHFTTVLIAISFLLL